ncbi:hypothetical protein RHMOL_Rhmol07G0140800 [Rhododendron molle]|uniref:Uncharacterized protein n=1 Tax=Rhododendron molle TaxID=49168 RepID=A0ACC0N0L1_RHOML|nr:hypothetical protein RHMOL_Rhmol07G0140800 [Rhododendron molle]
MRWQVQDGKSIDFWNDAWIPSLPNFKVPIPRPANSAINKVVDIIDANSGQWDIQKMSKEIPLEVVNAILEIPLAHVGRIDQLVWHFNPNRCYSVKSGYHIALQNLSEKDSNQPGTSFKLAKEVWKVLWKMKVPNKNKNFWWRVCRNILATKKNLFKRRCAQDNLCPICDCEVESIDHMLFMCPWANLVWFGCNIKPFGDLRGNGSAVKWIDDMKSPVLHSRNSKEAENHSVGGRRSKKQQQQKKEEEEEEPDDDYEDYRPDPQEDSAMAPVTGINRKVRSFTPEEREAYIKRVVEREKSRWKNLPKLLGIPLEQQRRLSEVSTEKRCGTKYKFVKLIRLCIGFRTVATYYVTFQANQDGKAPSPPRNFQALVRRFIRMHIEFCKEEKKPKLTEGPEELDIAQAVACLSF